MKKLILVLILFSLPALAQKKEDKRLFDSWTVGLRQNKSTGMPENYISKDRLTYQFGFLKKNYYVFGESKFTFRTGVLFVTRDAEIEGGGKIYTAKRLFVDVPLTVNYPISSQFDFYLGVQAAVKVASSATGPNNFELGQEPSCLAIPIVGIDYDMGGWRLGYFIETGAGFSEDWRQSSQGFTGRFNL
jgi:hypothetical protein